MWRRKKKSKFKEEEEEETMANNNVWAYLHVARAKIHLEIHGGVPGRRGAVLTVRWRQMMRMKGVQLLRVELLMMKGRLMIAAEGVPPRLVPRAAATPGGTTTPRATAASAATGTDPQDATTPASNAATAASPSARCELVRAGFNLPPDGPTCNHKRFLLVIPLLVLKRLLPRRDEALRGPIIRKFNRILSIMTAFGKRSFAWKPRMFLASAQNSIEHRALPRNSLYKFEDSPGVFLLRICLRDAIIHQNII